MNIDAALQWADRWGRPDSEIPIADAHALAALADEVRRLRLIEFAAKETILDNLHLADGDVCTLQALRDAVFPDGIPE